MFFVSWTSIVALTTTFSKLRTQYSYMSDGEKMGKYQHLSTDQSCENRLEWGIFLHCDDLIVAHGREHTESKWLPGIEGMLNFTSKVIWVIR